MPSAGNNAKNENEAKGKNKIPVLAYFQKRGTQGRKRSWGRK